MTAAERIDANLDRILRASGSALRHYTMPSTLAALRREMRAIMVEESVVGTDAERMARSGRGETRP